MKKVLFTVCCLLFAVCAFAQIPIDGDAEIDGDFTPKDSGAFNIGTLAKPFHIIYVDSCNGCGAGAGGGEILWKQDTPGEIYYTEGAADTLFVTFDGGIAFVGVPGASIGCLSSEGVLAMIPDSNFMITDKDFNPLIVLNTIDSLFQAFLKTTIWYSNVFVGYLDTISIQSEYVNLHSDGNITIKSTAGGRDKSLSMFANGANINMPINDSINSIVGTYYDTTGGDGFTEMSFFNKNKQRDEVSIQEHWNTDHPHIQLHLMDLEADSVAITELHQHDGILHIENPVGFALSGDNCRLLVSPFFGGLMSDSLALVAHDGYLVIGNAEAGSTTDLQLFQTADSNIFSNRINNTWKFEKGDFVVSGDGPEIIRVTSDLVALQVTGNGNTSSTAAQLVTNSDGDTLALVKDNGNVLFQNRVGNKVQKFNMIPNIGMYQRLEDSLGNLIVTSYLSNTTGHWTVGSNNSSKMEWIPEDSLAAWITDGSDGFIGVADDTFRVQCDSCPVEVVRLSAILQDNASTPHFWRLAIDSTGVLTTTDLGTTP